MTRWARRLAAAGLGLMGLAMVSNLGWGAPPALAPPSPEQLADVQAALARGAFSEAVDRLELWSDQGMVDATLSFDRGVAYLGRAESSAKRATDLGQAAAAFEEALHLNPDDEEARVALGRIREALSERRAKRDDPGVVARPRLMRALLGLIGENVWAVLGAVGSLVLSAGLGARLFSGSHEVRLGGSIAAALGGGVLLAGAGMALAGRDSRQHFAPAVVIVQEARLLDAEGRPLSGQRAPAAGGTAGDRVPEGSLVYIAEARGGLLRVEWGEGEAWLNAAQVRRISW